jgi:phage terminase Nu1 subunit (DNA packaging protein)
MARVNPAHVELARLNQQQAAYLLGVTSRTLRDWADAPRNRDGTYDARDLVKWYATRNTLAATDDFENQRERLAAAQAERVEMENAIRRGQLAECAAVQAGWADHIAAARAKLLSLPAKLGPQLTNISDASVAADKIRADIYAAIDELSEWELPETDDDGGGNAPADGERLEKPAAPDRERVGGRAPATV